LLLARLIKENIMQSGRLLLTGLIIAVLAGCSSAPNKETKTVAQSGVDKTPKVVEYVEEVPPTSAV